MSRSDSSFRTADKIRKALRHLVAQDRFEAPLAVDAGVELEALLSELEQAERERDEARQALDQESTPFQHAYNAACARADEAEARLAKGAPA